MNAAFAPVFIVFVVFGSLLVGLGIVSWTIVKLTRGNDVNSREESQMIQEIYHGMSKMEQRVEVLETLLLEREQKGGGQ